jgi:hypothetical protein
MVVLYPSHALIICMVPTPSPVLPVSPPCPPRSSNPARSYPTDSVHRLTCTRVACVPNSLNTPKPFPLGCAATRGGRPHPTVHTPLPPDPREPLVLSALHSVLLYPRLVNLALSEMWGIRWNQVACGGVSLSRFNHHPPGSPLIPPLHSPPSSFTHTTRRTMSSLTAKIQVPNHGEVEVPTGLFM